MTFLSPKPPAVVRQGPPWTPTRKSGSLLNRPEKDYQQAVLDLARSFGWRVYHPWLSVRSEAGWPDLFMVKGNRCLAAELKSRHGKVSREQREWLDALAACGIATYIWVDGETDIRLIAEILTRAA